MIPTSLANAFYSKDSLFAPMPILGGYQAGSNVVVVDFGRKPLHRDPAPSVEAIDPMKWLAIATERLAALHRFSNGWDGNGSRAVSDAALTKAHRILAFAFNEMTFVAPPVAVPCSDGALQLEWWLTDTRFELCIEADGAIEGWGLDRVSGHEVSADGTDAIELLSKWSGRLSADKLALPA